MCWRQAGADLPLAPSDEDARLLKVLGLTGGIAMGKTHAARVFRRAHVPVFDADVTVHALQARGGVAVGPIGRAFPDAIRDGAVDRAALRPLVLGRPDRLRVLEGIVHPLVQQAMQRFVQRQRRAGASLVVLDVPLLLEGTRRTKVDQVVVVSAPAAVQRQRLAQRGSMNSAMMAAVLARQMPDAQKQRLADVVIRTGLSRHHATQQVRRLIRASR